MLRVITLQLPVSTPVKPDVGLKVFSANLFLSLQQLANESALSDM